MDMIDMLFGFCGGKKLYTGDLLNILQIKMAVGNYKKLLNKDKNESKSDNLLDKDSEDEYQSHEAIQDSQNAKLLDEESQAYQSGEICKQWKNRRCCTKTYVIIVAVCCIVLLAASVAISLGITHKCTPNITSNCSEPPVVSDSTVSRYGIYSFYSCNHGFYPNGESIIVCQDGDWSAVKFHCSKECGSPPNIRYSTHKISGYMPGAVTSYHCLSGYVPVGKTKIVCYTNGQWSSSDLSCLKDCGNPPKRGLSKTFYTSTYTGSKAIYYCDSSYTAEGNPVITCQDDGTWTWDYFDCKYIVTYTAPGDESSSNIQDIGNLILILVLCSMLIYIIKICCCKQICS